jgi:hypothetical protein
MQSLLSIFQEVRDPRDLNARVTEITLHPWHAEHGSEPADIDTHPIPACPAKAGGTHFHHDCPFIFVAPKIAIRFQERNGCEASTHPCEPAGRRVAN